MIKIRKHTGKSNDKYIDIIQSRRFYTLPEHFRGLQNRHRFQINFKHIKKVLGYNLKTFWYKYFRRYTYVCNGCEKELGHRKYGIIKDFVYCKECYNKKR